MGISAVDLFCGVGGLTRGLLDAGIDVKAGVDVEERCQYPYEANNDSEFLKRDISAETSSELAGTLSTRIPKGDMTVLAGCPPCQPFSSLSFGNEGESSDHENWGLLRDFAVVAGNFDPDVVIMENVPQVTDHEPYREFRERLQDEQGYFVRDDIVDCRKYGLPQQRRRLVFLASKKAPIQFPEPTHRPHEHVTVEDAFAEHDLEEIEAGEVSEADPLHRAQQLSETNLERIRQSVPGGTWRDWDPELRLDCHKEGAGARYEAVYGRMAWEKPAPTITTQFYKYGTGRFGHPNQDRAISLREGALLQTFPPEYEFVGSEDETEFKPLGQLIGNAVPVKLAEVLGGQVLRHLEEGDTQERLEAYSGD